MKKTSIAVGSAILLSLVLAVPTYAQDNGRRMQGRGDGPQGMGQFNERRGQQAPGVTGAVTGISGTTITVSSRAMGGNSGETASYTVDASAATIKKITNTSSEEGKPTVAAISLADLKVGNTVMVAGTVSGTTVKATAVTVGIFPAQRNGEDNGIGRDAKLGLGISGTVDTVSGSTVTVKTDRRGNQEDGTFTVDASAAVIKKLTVANVAGAQTSTETAITVAMLAAGDSVIVKGTVTGTTVKATEITVRPHATDDQPQQLRGDAGLRRGQQLGNNATLAGVRHAAVQPAAQKQSFLSRVGNSIKNFFGSFKDKK
jgi:hypothetical protein